MCGITIIHCVYDHCGIVCEIALVLDVFLNTVKSNIPDVERAASTHHL